jgi:hypothetical protein
MTTRQDEKIAMFKADINQERLPSIGMNCKNSIIHIILLFRPGVVTHLRQRQNALD